MNTLNGQAQHDGAMNEILAAADLNWVIIKAPADAEAARPAAAAAASVEAQEQSMLLRSDNKERLAIVPSTHQPWQPREVLDFYFALAAFYGWALERVGHVRGGRRLWGLLNTGERVTLPGGFSATMHVLASTRCDSPLAAQARAVCVLEPGGIVLPATPGCPTEARIGRSFEFLTPGDLAEIGELVRECTSFPAYLSAFSSRTVSSEEIYSATAGAYSSRRADDVPSPAALRAITRALDRTSGDATALDLLHALATLSDTRNRKRWGHEFRGVAWFGAGFKREQIVIETLARILRQGLGQTGHGSSANQHFSAQISTAS